jgi:hypothetical protein
MCILNGISDCYPKLPDQLTLVRIFQQGMSTLSVNQSTTLMLYNHVIVLTNMIHLCSLPYVTTSASGKQFSNTVLKRGLMLIVKVGDVMFKPRCFRGQFATSSHLTKLLEHLSHTGCCRGTAVDTEPLKLKVAYDCSCMLTTQSAESSSVWSWLNYRHACNSWLRGQPVVLLLLHHVLLLL